MTYSANQELAICTRSLTKCFDRHIAVRDVDLEVGSGEVYGLIGPNGAGKTTLIRMLAAAEIPTAGEIFLSGEPLLQDHQANSTLKRRLGFLPDDYPLYDDLNVWDYLDYFARLYHLTEPRRSQRLWEVLDLVSLAHKRDSRINTLSRGMKQRLSLARTIIHEPILLLLDEPVSGLDPIARQQFRDVIKVLQEAGMTILISSHVLSDLEELCTSIGIMEFGHLVESAKLADLYQRLSQQQILISVLGDLDPIKAELRQHPQVERVEVLKGSVGSREAKGAIGVTGSHPSRLRIQFSGGLEDCANLLQALIQAGIRLTEFQPVREDLEAMFLKLDHKQSS